MLTKSKLRLPSVDMLLKISEKLRIPLTPRVEFYTSLLAKLGEAPGFIVTQKNTRIDEEIVVVAGENYRVIAGNVDFYLFDSMDEAIVHGLALHTVFKQPFLECKRLALFMGKLMDVEFCDGSDKMVNVIYNCIFN